MAIQIKRGGTNTGTSHQPGRIEYGSNNSHNAPAPASSISASGFSFDSAMETAELENLLDQLYELSDKLSVFPSSKLIEEYRNVLHELLKRAAKGMKIRRDMRWRKTDRKMYITIERAQEAMEELEEAFQYEGDKTKALALMEEIKGCLISLLM